MKEWFYNLILTKLRHYDLDKAFWMEIAIHKRSFKLFEEGYPSTKKTLDRYVPQAVDRILDSLENEKSISVKAAVLRKIMRDLWDIYDGSDLENRYDRLVKEYKLISDYEYATDFFDGFNNKGELQRVAHFCRSSDGEECTCPF